MIFKADDVAEIQKQISNLDAVFIGKGKHYIQEDQPDAIGQAISHGSAFSPKPDSFPRRQQPIESVSDGTIPAQRGRRSGWFVWVGELDEGLDRHGNGFLGVLSSEPEFSSDLEAVGHGGDATGSCLGVEVLA